jgi:PTH1 family peptidyl-tRNA hydrolase
MRTIIGIGNPGAEYEGTRHNVGFEVVDAAASRLKLAFEEARGPVLVAEGTHGGHPVRLVKPQSYVNRSGQALAAFTEGSAGDPGDLLVVLDDMALDPGRLRLRARGSHGGHNGLRSLLAFLATEELPRLRVGIGMVDGDLWRDHVLTPFSAAEREVMEPALERAVEGVLAFLEGDEFLKIQERVNAASLPGATRGTGVSGAAARAAPKRPTAERSDATGESVMEVIPHKYEGMFLLNNSLVPPEGGKAVDVVSAILQKHKMKMVKADVWDERKLAYPIKRQKRGTYVLTHFEGDGEKVDTISRDLNLNEEVLRYMFIRHENEFPEFPKPRKDAQAIRESHARREGTESPRPTAPEAAEPEAAAPEAAEPEAAAPEAAEPEATAPEATVPETPAPEDDAPVGDVSEEDTKRPEGD